MLDQTAVNPETAGMSDIETGKRQQFQFSLKTLMLATTLPAVFLSSVLILGPCLAFPIGAYLLCLLHVRIKWGYEEGVIIAGRNSAIVLACLGLVAAILAPMLVLWIPALCLVGLLAGFFGFLLVDAIVCLWNAELH